MRVLISSYSPYTTTSYGQMTRLLWTELYKTGRYELLQHAMMYQPGTEGLPWKCVSTNPRTADNDQDTYGAVSFERIVKQYKPDVVWALSDLYMTPYIDFYKKKYRYKIVRWTVSEAENVDTTFLPSVVNADKIVFMTKLAATAWGKITSQEYPVIGAPVDPEVFTPISYEDRSIMRKEMSDGCIEPDDFLMLYVGQNQARKNPWIPFKILANLIERETPTSRKAKLWIHSPSTERGYDYKRLTKYWGLKNKDRVFVTPSLSSVSGIPYQNFKDIYNISDLLVSLSKAEGFCIPLAEAASCGIPALVTDYAGSKEVGRAMGHLMVPPIEFDYNIANVKNAIPDTRYAIDLAHSMLIKNDTARKAISSDLRKAAMASPYVINSVVKAWDELLQEVKDIKIDNSIGEMI